MALGKVSNFFSAGLDYDAQLFQKSGLGKFGSGLELAGKGVALFKPEVGAVLGGIGAGLGKVGEFADNRVEQIEARKPKPSFESIENERRYKLRGDENQAMYGSPLGTWNPVGIRGY